ncbi:MAG: hypothetical protein JST67_09285 [Bacteroidetes bacterium]|nr:hypothetical protein [Bacteroidota bacterium]
MSIEVKDPVIIAAIYLWIGFVVAISFMEAWLKFRAPGVTVQIGLNIGRLVFNALNKSEWIFALAILISLFISKQSLFSVHNILYFIPCICLILQTAWLLPALDKRAELFLKGIETPASSLHFYYVFMELAKVITLFIYGIKQFK